MRPFQVPPLLLAALLLLLSPEPSTAFVFPPAPHRAVPSTTKPSHALSPLAATATTSTSSSSSTPSTGTTTLHPVLHALHQTASRAAPPGSTRRSLLKKVARGMLALGGGVGTAASAASAAGAAAPDRTPGRYKNLGSTGTLEKEQFSSGSSRSSNAADEKVKKEVLDTTRVWLQTVTSNKPTAAVETSALYAKDAVLWGTVSEQLRVTPGEILNYFEFFAGLPGLRVAAYQPFVRVWGGDTAINDGYYVFAWRGPDGVEVQKHARFSFVYRREGGREGVWKIVDHHSSLLPTAPAKLVKATTVVL